LHQTIISLNQDFYPYFSAYEYKPSIFHAGLFQYNPQGQLPQASGSTAKSASFDIANFFNVGRLNLLIKMFSQLPMGSFLQQYPEMDACRLLAKANMIISAPCYGSFEGLNQMPSLLLGILAHFVRILFYLGFFSEKLLAGMGSPNDLNQRKHFAWLVDNYFNRDQLPAEEVNSYDDKLSVYTQTLTWRQELQLVPALLEWVSEAMNSSLLDKRDRLVVQEIYNQVVLMHDDTLEESKGRIQPVNAS